MLASTVEQIRDIHTGQNEELQQQIESLKKTFEYNSEIKGWLNRAKGSIVALDKQTYNKKRNLVICNIVVFAAILIWLFVNIFGK